MSTKVKNIFWKTVVFSCFFSMLPISEVVAEADEVWKTCRIHRVGVYPDGVAMIACRDNPKKRYIVPKDFGDALVDRVISLATTSLVSGKMINIHIKDGKEVTGVEIFHFAAE